MSNINLSHALLAVAIASLSNLLEAISSSIKITILNNNTLKQLTADFVARLLILLVLLIIINQFAQQNPPRNL